MEDVKLLMVIWIEGSHVEDRLGFNHYFHYCSIQLLLVISCFNHYFHYCSIVLGFNHYYQNYFEVGFIFVILSIDFMHSFRLIFTNYQLDRHLHLVMVVIVVGFDFLQDYFLELIDFLQEDFLELIDFFFDLSFIEQ